MEHYIGKDVLVAEIERRMKSLTHEMSKFYYASNYNEWKFAVNEYKSLMSFLDTLDVKEVDLENNLKGFQGYYAHENGGELPSAIDIAKHFFELGLKAKQE